MIDLLRLLRRPMWRRRARQLLFALACLQVVAPAAAAVADAWRLDQRTPYAHVDGEGTTGCVVVHRDDCVLCSIATTPQGRPVAALAVARSPREPVGRLVSSLAPIVSGCARFTPSRAPPGSHV